MGTKLEKCRAQHPNTETHHRWATAEGRHLLRQDFGLCTRKTATSVLFRPSRHRPAALSHALKPQLLRVRGKLPFTPTPTGVVVA